MSPPTDPWVTAPSGPAPPTHGSPRRSGRANALRLGLIAVAAAAVAAITTLVLVGIWPGVLKLTAPVVCPTGYDEPLVVRDTTQVRPGETSTTFTMYCMNERGEVTDEGILRPAGLVCLGVLAVIGLVVLVVLLVRMSRRRRRAA